MDEKETVELLRLLTSPVVVVTSAWKARVNAQIANSAARASRVPSVPRVTIIISKTNYTHELIMRSKAFCLHFLRKDQMNLVREFGFFSGREKGKLQGVSYRMGATGSPVLADAYAYMDCKVRNAMDNGASTIFLGEAVDAGRLKEGEILTSEYFRANIPPEWLPEYLELERRALEFAEKHIRNMNYTPWTP